MAKKRGSSPKTHRHSSKQAAPAPSLPRVAPAPAFPSLREILQPRGPFLIPLILLVGARAMAWINLPIASEDAYITFRYARHLTAGNGIVFNPGELVMGFTSPLWVLWNAAGFIFTKDPVLWTRATNLLADAVSLLVMGGLLKRHVSSLSAWIFAFFFAAWPYFAAVSVSGMENSLMFTLIVLGAALAERRHLLTGPVLGALAFIRPEGVVSAAVLALGATWRDRIVAAVAAAGSWGAIAMYYGSVVPQSVSAKAQIYGTPGLWAGRHWWEWLSPMALGRWPVTGEGNLMLPLSALMGPAVVVGAVACWRLRHTAAVRAMAAALVVWLGYVVLGVAFFYWYLFVPLAGLAALAAVGLPKMIRGRALLISCVLVVLGAWSIARVLYIGRTQNEFHSFNAVATYLRDNSEPGEKVMLEPIGIIGYWCPLVVIDEVGLVSPQVAARRLGGPGWYADVALRERPEWIVIRSSQIQSTSAFAGAGAPFRNSTERDSLFARYTRVHVADRGRGDLEVHRRVR